MHGLKCGLFNSNLQTVLLQQYQGVCSASHTLSTEIGFKLKTISVRLNVIAPGGFESETTTDITSDTIGQNILPLQARRGGT